MATMQNPNGWHTPSFSSGRWPRLRYRITNVRVTRNGTSGNISFTMLTQIHGWFRGTSHTPSSGRRPERIRVRATGGGTGSQSVVIAQDAGPRSDTGNWRNWQTNNFSINLTNLSGTRITMAIDGHGFGSYVIHSTSMNITGLTHSTPQSTFGRRWNGSQWVGTRVRRSNGSQWVDARVRRFNGSQWVDVR